jgi:PAS domain S-box-containing protein
LKAIAVLDGKADPRICLPEALERAQSLSNVIIDNSPNGIIVVDEDLLVRDMNPHARNLLGFAMDNPTGLPIQGILPSEELEKILLSIGRKTQYLTSYYDLYGRLFQHAIVKIPGQELRVIILMDRTEEEKSRKALEDLREKTMDVTQQVINEQMRTAQEIASLLGEATARSKIAMVQLQKVMHGEDHG